MLDIPAGLDGWHPNAVTAWLRDIEDDPNVTDAEYDRAQAAADAALLGTPAQA